MEGASVFRVLWLGAMETEQRRLLLCVCSALQKSDEIGMCLASSHCLRVCVFILYGANTHGTITSHVPVIQRSTHLLPLLSVQLGNILAKGTNENVYKNTRINSIIR